MGESGVTILLLVLLMIDSIDRVDSLIKPTSRVVIHRIDFFTYTLLLRHLRDECDQFVFLPYRLSESLTHLLHLNVSGGQSDATPSP